MRSYLPDSGNNPSSSRGTARIYRRGEPCRRASARLRVLPCWPMRPLLFLACAVCASPGIAVAATDSLSQGRIFYEEFEYKQCLVALDRAMGEQPSAEDTVWIQIYAGLCHYHLGQLEHAESAFRIALRMDAGARLPPLSSPKIQRFFNEIAKDLPPPPAAHDRPAKVELAPKPAPPENPALAIPLPPSPRQRNLLLPGSLAGGAAVAGVVGAIFGAQAKQLEAQARAAEYDWDSVQLEKRAQRNALVANISFAVAIASTVAAVTTFVLDPQ